MISIKWKEIRKEQWILLLLAGILMMTVLFPSEKNNVLTGTDAKETKDETSADSNDSEEIQKLEKKLEQILERMDGAGEVSVMITEAVSRENVVEKDRPYTLSSSEDGSESGEKNRTNQESREEVTVFEKDSGGKEQPFVAKTLAPQIEGVLVLAQGADHAVVSKNITEAVMALFGIEAHKIKVMKRM